MAGSTGWRWSSPEKRLLPVVVGEIEPPPFLRNWVSVKVDPVAEPATWTRRVLDVLRSARGEAEYKLSDASRLERRQRLDEIASAAEEMRRGQFAGYIPWAEVVIAAI